MMPNMLSPADHWHEDGSSHLMAMVGRGGETPTARDVEDLLAEVEDPEAVACLEFHESETSRIREAVDMLKPWGVKPEVWAQSDGNVLVMGHRAGCQLWRLTQWHIAHLEDPEAVPEAYL
jgi:hypothetical protein